MCIIYTYKHAHSETERKWNAKERHEQTPQHNPVSSAAQTGDGLPTVGLSSASVQSTDTALHPYNSDRKSKASSRI